MSHAVFGAHDAARMSARYNDGTREFCLYILFPLSVQWFLNLVSHLVIIPQLNYIVTFIYNIFSGDSNSKTLPSFKSSFSTSSPAALGEANGGRMLCGQSRSQRPWSLSRNGQSIKVHMKYVI